MATRIVAIVVFVGAALMLIIVNGVNPFTVFVSLVAVAVNGYMVGEASERARNKKLNDEALEKAKASVAGAHVENDKLIVPIKQVNGVPVLNLNQRPVEHGS